MRLNCIKSLKGLFLLAILLGLGTSRAQATEINAEQREYFERHIRPVLIENCYKCHGGEVEKIKGDFNLTFREGLLTSGEQGGNIVPGNPDASALIKALRYEDPDFQMPPSGKLPELVIQYFEDWIAMGAPDPRDEAFKEGDTELADIWAQTLEHRKSWWSYQPITKPVVPVLETNTSTNPIDAFIQAGWINAGVVPAEKADPYALIRRLSFVLTGLPPTQDEITTFVEAAKIDHQAAVETTVDQLLASPRFGERWARHWMDWMRYAETHGSEGDPRIPHAWRYRDYLIRAFNADIPFDDLVREHLAGDTIPDPRINEELGIKESSLGIAQYRFVLHGYSPTDALDELVRFTDNQIDTISKAFLGTTVSCARCHNHKFDPISQTDFYALYGIMASSRPATIVVDSEERQNINRQLLAAHKQGIRAQLSEQWLSDLETLANHLRTPEAPWQKAIEEANSPLSPLHPWKKFQAAPAEELSPGWTALMEQWRASQDALAKRKAVPYPAYWDLAKEEDAALWTQHGNGLSGGSSKPGDYSLFTENDRIIEHIYPAGVYSHLLSSKHSGVLSSPRFDLTESNIYLRIIGSNRSLNRYVIQNYTRNGQVFPVKYLDDGKWYWQQWNLDYWQGESAYMELTTAPDQAVLVDDGKVRSWFGVTEVLMQGKDQPAPNDEMAEFVSPLYALENAVQSLDDLIERYKQSLTTCILAWRNDTMTNEQARYLEYFINQGLLTNTLGVNPKVDDLVTAFRRLEQEVPVPIRAPGVLENKPFNQPLFTRGDHKKPEVPVSRRFLEAIDPTPYGDEDAGRLALAESIVKESNPLTARVIANRLWHHTFGQGIVTTPDDFGAMGQLPSNPELLDYLAQTLMDGDWSMKEMIRSMVTSDTFQLSAVPTAEANAIDPGNATFSHSHVRRLEGEAIRDALLATSGRLNESPPDGNVDGHSDRRSIYVRVIRNDLDPFLTTFDVPVPVSTKGRRDVTNVPTHSLTLMNDPFVRGQAEALAALVGRNTVLTAEARTKMMFMRVTGRPPTEAETKIMLDYVQQAEARPAGAEYDTALVAELDQLNSRKLELTAAIQQQVADAVAKDEELAKLPEQELRIKVAKAQVDELNRVNSQLETLKPLAGPSQPWVELAKSLYSLKEFTYLK